MTQNETTGCQGGGKDPFQSITFFAPGRKKFLNFPWPVESFTLPHLVGYSSGQRGQTVNLLAYAFPGSNPGPTTNCCEAVTRVRIPIESGSFLTRKLSGGAVATLSLGRCSFPRIAVGLPPISGKRWVICAANLEILHAMKQVDQLRRQGVAIEAGALQRDQGLVRRL